MKKAVTRYSLAFLVCILIQIDFKSAVLANTKRHLVIYGGLSAMDLMPVARKADFLIISNTRLEYLNRIKQINPQLIILKYHHALGVHKSYPEWDYINENENWFVHDKLTKSRLIEKKYGWYLMNNANESWRKFLAGKIVNTTDAIFDGVFIDDAWIRFVNKFISFKTKSAGWPLEEIIRDWEKNMILLLKQLRGKYPKKIFINGAYEQFIPFVDGYMDEGFVHSNWQPEAFFPSPAMYMQSLRRIERLKNFGKTILIQSGTKGERFDAIERVFHFCIASYFLISNTRTSFGFHPLHTYYFKGFPHYDDYALDLGKPKGEYYLYKKGIRPPNLVPNGNFDDGLSRWTVMRGNPLTDSKTKIAGSSILFNGTPTRSDQILSEFIPVKNDTKYTLSAYCKAENNWAGGGAGYKKLGLQGRFYDKYKKKIPGAFDLQFDAGTYDWLPFEITHTSPRDAAYFRIRLGFIGDGLGKGWVDSVYFGMAAASENILRRDFTKGIVLVNYGSKETAVDTSKIPKHYGINHLVIRAHEGKILLPNESNQSSPEEN